MITDDLVLAMSARCLVCGELLPLVLAPLHIEDHKEAGDMPDV